MKTTNRWSAGAQKCQSDARSQTRSLGFRQCLTPLLHYPILLPLLLSTLNLQLSTAFAVTTINPANKFAYGANLGWMDWRGDTNNGAVIGEYVCSGYIWGANCGWIHLGDGTPVNAINKTACGANSGWMVWRGERAGVLS